MDEDAIEAEHLMSDTHLEPLYGAWLAQVEDPARRARGTAHLRIVPNEMRRTVAAVDELYGGIERYLLESDLERAEVDAVRERLVE